VVERVGGGENFAEIVIRLVRVQPGPRATRLQSLADLSEVSTVLVGCRKVRVVVIGSGIPAGVAALRDRDSIVGIQVIILPLL
jgi:hypothetical protein